MSKYTLETIRQEAEEIKLEKENLEDEVKECLDLIAANKKRIAEIEGRLDTLSDAARAAKSCDRYGLYIAGF